MDMLRQKQPDEGRSKKSNEAALHCAEDGAVGEDGSVSAWDWRDRVRSRADCRQRVAHDAARCVLRGRSRSGRLPRYDASERDDGTGELRVVALVGCRDRV
jgi:hypothetical protein